ncbi:glucosyltransferase [Paecilomyces lecythidis]|uniref:Dol-P-Glc:Glc(2)Man(9)GlcNAc(2)-PP-Dol alpha-1,2-glucosyltransferase n=1 Tax=Paecilomyces lecythidis TaxID=3004212 RepID=A0ABR3YBJ5_9EURO
MSSRQPESNWARAARYAVPFVLLSIPFWWSKVNATVPEPYLDEVFHVRQAQAYWAHKWTQWDPKITTPPGLYLWSYVLCAGLLLLRGSPKEAGTTQLRATNVVAMAVILPWRLQTLLDFLRRERNTRPAGAWLSHTVLNICLFPPLFFFSGLYYTDILALLVVIEAYNWDLKRDSEGGISGLIFLLVGLVSLVFRQTNIFWASLFFGGLQAVRTLRRVCKPCKSSKISGIVKGSSQNELYDPLVGDATITDFFKTAVSLAITVLTNLPQVVLSVIPHLIILAAFGTFVWWNGSVVLGHKEFHTASLHLPQMLYIWPYFVFFSWPILLLPMLNLVLPNSFLPTCLDYGFPSRQRGLPSLLTVLGIIPIMLAVVHFNTIVHPFTLADNRHYVFYVFRLLLRTHPAVKYVATLAYFVCAWIVLSSFSFSSLVSPPRLAQVSPSSAPSTEQSVAENTGKDEKPVDQKKNTKKKGKASRKGVSFKEPASEPQQQPISPEALAKVRAHMIQRQQPQYPIRVSFIIIWLASTALSLVTAPLVEPRYFIIPWVMWRLHLPPQPMPILYRQRRTTDEKELFIAKLVASLPLILETVWFLAINFVTGYMFLNKGFEWPQEPGKVQRFMW